jgi:hypothetical protein
MNIADEEEFSPDKLRANLERVYMTIVSEKHHASRSSAHTATGYQHDRFL